MREILFRGKTITSKEWIYGDLLQYAGGAQIWENTEQGKFNAQIIPETVGQYTGMKDKSGKKIFEFDICKAYIHISKVGKKELTGAICFEEGAFKFKCKRYIFNIYDLSASIEVIGNVFNSPELLEEDKT